MNSPALAVWRAFESCSGDTMATWAGISSAMASPSVETMCSPYDTPSSSSHLTRCAPRRGPKGKALAQEQATKRLRALQHLEVSAPNAVATLRSATPKSTTTNVNPTSAEESPRSVASDASKASASSESKSGTVHSDGIVESVYERKMRLCDSPVGSALLMRKVRFPDRRSLVAQVLMPTMFPTPPQMPPSPPSRRIWSILKPRQLIPEPDTLHPRNLGDEAETAEAKVKEATADAIEMADGVDPSTHVGMLLPMELLMDVHSQRILLGHVVLFLCVLAIAIATAALFWPMDTPPPLQSGILRRLSIRPPLRTPTWAEWMLVA